jgi:hypothetical protein
VARAPRSSGRVRRRGRGAAQGEANNHASCKWQSAGAGPPGRPRVKEKEAQVSREAAAAAGRRAAPRGACRPPAPRPFGPPCAGVRAWGVGRGGGRCVRGWARADMFGEGRDCCVIQNPGVRPGHVASAISGGRPSGAFAPRGREAPVVGRRALGPGPPHGALWATEVRGLQHGGGRAPRQMSRPQKPSCPCRTSDQALAPQNVWPRQHPPAKPPGLGPPAQTLNAAPRRAPRRAAPARKGSPPPARAVTAACASS